MSDKRSHIFKRFAVPRAFVVAALLAGFVVLGALGLRGTSALADNSPHYYLESTSQTVYRGFFPRNAPPALGGTERGHRAHRYALAPGPHQPPKLHACR